MTTCIRERQAVESASFGDSLEKRNQVILYKDAGSHRHQLNVIASSLNLLHNCKYRFCNIFILNQTFSLTMIEPRVTCVSWYPRREKAKV